MRQIFILIIITFFPIQAHSQLHKANKGRIIYFAEIKHDSAHIEVYYHSHPDFVIKDFDKVILLSDAISVKAVELTVGKNDYLLKFRRQSNKRPETIHLKPCELSDRTHFRNTSYSSHKRIQMMNLQDSLSGPDIPIHLNVNNTYKKLDTYLPEKEYTKLVDKITDSLTMEISLLKNPIVDLYYSKANFITMLDTVEIYNLLSNTNYKFRFSNFLLYKVAIERSEILIHYIDSDPHNKDLVLRAIRNHHNYKEINKKVKETEFSSTGKKKIVKQKSKRILTDIGVTTAYVTIILTELAALTLIGIWIF